MSKYVSLDDVEVIDVSDMAVQIGYKDYRGEAANAWIPRSLCEEGDNLAIGDDDIRVAKWFAIREDLPHDD